MFEDNKRLKVLLAALGITVCGVAGWLLWQSRVNEMRNTSVVGSAYCFPTITIAEQEIKSATAAGKVSPEFEQAKGYIEQKPYTGENIPEGIKMLEKLAAGGDGNASLYLGTLYQDGRKVPRDDAVAMKWFLKASEQGSIAAFSYIFGIHLKNDNYKEAISWLRKAAEKGDVSSQFSLGTRLMGRLHQFNNDTYSYYSETSKIKDRAEDEQVRDCPDAEKWLLKAAGNPDEKNVGFYQLKARNALGIFYAIECGNDIQKGLKWWRSSQSEPWWKTNIERAYKDESSQNGLMNYHRERADQLATESFFWLREAANTDKAYNSEWEQAAYDNRAKHIEKRPLLLKSPLRGSEAVIDLSFRPLLLLPEDDLKNIESVFKGDAAAQYALSQALRRESLNYYKEAYFWTLLTTTPFSVEFMQGWQRRISPYLSSQDIEDTRKRAQEVLSKQ